jgi:hypothetical protein
LAAVSDSDRLRETLQAPGKPSCLIDPAWFTGKGIGWCEGHCVFTGDAGARAGAAARHRAYRHLGYD